mmetsp:Transcript_9491/g.18553  ORF Transcript_9491/g.18553 Transcript_9491/m.18553 type:complete len:302 (-) Transcript_9491:2971-3876(-)
MEFQEFIFEFLCPTAGCILALLVFTAPIKDLKQALRRGSLGSLNTIPWAVMNGNCLGWCAYAYYMKDPFILAPNLPGLIISLWLNIGAFKLQYLAQIDAIRREPGHSRQNDEDNRNVVVLSENGRSNESLISQQQDAIFFRIIGAWAVILVFVGWMGGLWKNHFPHEPQTIIGILVNINLVFFYAAPLQTMKTVLESKSSDTIHARTVTMNVLNGLFWMLYGLARKDVIIYGPNSMGLLLGMAQCTLCYMYPKRLKSNTNSSQEQESVEFETLPAYTDNTDTSEAQHKDDHRPSAVERRIV